MRKVVDSNSLQKNELRDYLSKSKTNIAVLTDYAAMEAYKGNTLASIYKSMSVLSEFPAQVIILKSTRTICGLSGRRAGLQKRLIDTIQTKEFSLYCRHLTLARAGNEGLQHQLVAFGEEATQHLDRILADAQLMPETINHVADAYTEDERRLLRTGRPFTNVMIEKLIVSVLRIAITMFDGHPSIQHLPPRHELPNTFIFRAALCVYLLALDWISVGSAKGARAETIRNDMIDVTFAAYATYFDGLLSNDGKAKRIHQEARLLLDGVFGCQIT